MVLYAISWLLEIWYLQIVVSNMSILPESFQNEDSGFTIFPSQEQTENYLVDILAYLQKWGLLICFIIIFVIIILSLIANMRKNPRLVRVFNFIGYGAGIIGLCFVFLPYFTLENMASPEGSAIPSIPSDAESHSKMAILMFYLQRWEVLVSLSIVLISILFAIIAKIKKNLKLQRVHLFFAYGAIISGVLLFYLPTFIINKLQ